MKTIALISGGKDSYFNILHCIAQGHDIIALGNLYPNPNTPSLDEVDSHLFQTVGHDWIDIVASCLIHPYTTPTSTLTVPIFRKALSRPSVMTQLHYTFTPSDEVEDLYTLLLEAQQRLPELQAVSVGAILSSYQRIRVEHVCQRLGLTSLAYLWEAHQEKLLESMISVGLEAVIIKVATLGLDVKHLGKSISELKPLFIELSSKYECSPCGEGGEYETLTLDCPAFCKRLKIMESTPVLLSNDPYAPSAYLSIQHLATLPKPQAFNYTTLRRWLVTALLPPPFFFDLSLAPSQAPPPLLLPTLGPVSPTSLSTPPGPRAPSPTSSSSSSSSLSSSSLAFKRVGPYFAITGGHTTWVAPEKDVDEAVPLVALLDQLRDTLQLQGGQLEDLLFVQLGVNDLSKFSLINEIYARYFQQAPPARACVQLDLPHTLQLDAIGVLPHEPKGHLHVQSISYWAPANIGPYSQRCWRPPLGFVAGQLGLVPETMQFPSSTLVDQWWYAVRHVTRLGVHPPRWSWLAGVVYVVESLHMNEVRAMASNDPHGLLHPSSPPLLTVVTVAKLPRNAMIEIVPFGIVGVHPDLGPTPLSSWSSSVYKKEVQPHWTFLGVHAGSSWGVYFTVTFHGTYPTPSTDLLSPPGGMRDVVKMYMDKVGGSLKQLLFLQCFFNGALMATSDVVASFQEWNASFIPCRALEDNAKVVVSCLFVLTEKITKL